jgi:ribonuclease Y
MEFALVATAAVVALAVGVVVGFLARGQFANQAIKSAQDKAARIVAEARAQQKELILEAKDEKLRLSREAEDEARAKRGELSGLETRLLARDEQLDLRSDMLEQRDRKLLDRERELENSRQQVAEAQQEHVAALERVSGMTAEDAKAQLLEAVRDEAERDGVRIGKAIERAARDEAEDRAREIVISTMQRIAADHTAEHTVSSVHLPNDEMKGRIIGREGRNIRALEQATGVDLIIDDTPETVVISAFDPVRREVARLALTKLMMDGRIHPGRIEEVVAKARAEVDLVMRQAGEQAIYDAGIPGAARPRSSSSWAASSTAPATARTCSCTRSKPAGSRP